MAAAEGAHDCELRPGEPRCGAPRAGTGDDRQQKLKQMLRARLVAWSSRGLSLACRNARSLFCSVQGSFPRDSRTTRHHKNRWDPEHIFISVSEDWLGDGVANSGLREEKGAEMT